MTNDKTFHDYFKKLKGRVLRKRPWIKNIELKIEKEKDGRLEGSLFATSDYKDYRVQGKARSVETLTSLLLIRLLKKSKEEKKKRIIFSKYLEAL